MHERDDTTEDVVAQGTSTYITSTKTYTKYFFIFFGNTIYQISLNSQQADYPQMWVYLTSPFTSSNFVEDCEANHRR